MKKIFITFIFILLIVSIGTVHSQEEMNINTDVPESLEWRTSEAVLSALTTNKTKVGSGELATIKLILLGIDQQILPNRNVSLKFFVNSKKIGQVEGITDQEGIFRVRIASDRKQKTRVETYDNSLEPPLKLIKELTIEFSGSGGRRLDQKADIVLKNKDSISPISFFSQTVLYLKRLFRINQ